MKFTVVWRKRYQFENAQLRNNKIIRVNMPLNISHVSV